jgi:hypothetical protein
MTNRIDNDNSQFNGEEKKPNKSEPPRPFIERRDTQLYTFINKVNGETRSEIKMFFIGLFALVIIIGYFLNQGLLKAQKELELLTKNTTYVIASNEQFRKNLKVFEKYPTCFNCHNVSDNLLPKTTLTLSEFTDYVRGNNRFIKNTIMPKFDNTQISDQELMEIWKILY